MAVGSGGLTVTEIMNMVIFASITTTQFVKVTRTTYFKKSEKISAKEYNKCKGCNIR